MNYENKNDKPMKITPGSRIKLSFIYAITEFPTLNKKSCIRHANF